VRADIHHQADVAMPGQFLGVARRDANQREIGYKDVPISVEVGVAALRVDVFREVALITATAQSSVVCFRNDSRTDSVFALPSKQCSSAIEPANHSHNHSAFRRLQFRYAANSDCQHDPRPTGKNQIDPQEQSD
jgi:hypothetical protein